VNITSLILNDIYSRLILGTITFVGPALMLCKFSQFRRSSTFHIAPIPLGPSCHDISCVSCVSGDLGRQAIGASHRAVASVHDQVMKYGQKPKFHLARHVPFRHYTTCSSCWARRNERVEPVELVVTSVSSCVVRQARHSQNTWARTSRRDMTIQVKFGLFCFRTAQSAGFDELGAPETTVLWKRDGDAQSLRPGVKGRHRSKRITVSRSLNARAGERSICCASAVQVQQLNVTVRRSQTLLLFVRAKGQCW